MEEGTFAIPLARARIDTASRSRLEELGALLSGIDLSTAKRRKRYRRAARIKHFDFLLFLLGNGPVSAYSNRTVRHRSEQLAEGRRDAAEDRCGSGRTTGSFPAEQNKYRSLLRELLDAQRNRKSEQLSKEQLALFLVEQNFELKVGDQVSVVVAPSTVPGDSYLYAIEITNVGTQDEDCTARCRRCPVVDGDHRRA